VGLFAAGEKPTGSRDPYGLRRAAQGVVKILTDLPDLGVNRPVDLPLLIQQAYQGHVAEGGARDGWRALPLGEFFAEREAHLFERRGYRSDESRAVAAHWGYPRLALKRIEALSNTRASKDFEALAALFKRVKNITKGFERAPSVEIEELKKTLREPAELALASEFIQRWPAIDKALLHAQYVEAMREIISFRSPVEQFFKDVMVMTDDRTLRDARLNLLSRLRDAILQIADIAEIAPEETPSG
jgi:glycyl-tRNA synthetase beta chain